MTSTRMVLARLRGLIIHIRTTSPNCLRCEDAKLRVMDCHPGLRNYECPICFRRYSQRDGGALVDRWLMPITLPLYAFVFRPFRVRPAEEIADEFRQQKDPAYLKLLVQEIMGELDRPTQQLTDMYRTGHSESELREFLRRFVTELEKREKRE